MISDNLNEITIRTKNNAAEKWFARRERRKAEMQPKVTYTNYLQGIPKEWCEILKQQCRLCTECKNSTRNIVHMNQCHNVDIKSYKEIWDSIKEFHEAEVEKHEKRKKK